MMYKFFLLLLFPFLAQQLHLDRNAPEEEEIIWSADRRLSWEDFRGVPAAKGFTGATTHATIKVIPKVSGYFNNRIEVEVKAIFSCDKSWAKEKARESDYLLNHEQRHFDIAELYARKIRTALRDYRITPRNYRSIKETVIQPLFSEYVAHDQSYDHLTVHGLKKAVQAQWDLQLDTELGLTVIEQGDQ